MNWLSDITPPGIKKIFRHREDDGNASLWSSCPSCGEMTFNKDLEAALQVCPNCNHHGRISPAARLESLFDNGKWDKVKLPGVTDDPLRFKDTKRYADRLRDSRRKTGEPDALIVGKGSLHGLPTIAGVQNFAFMGGSMGMALGEGLVKAAEEALAAKAPLILFTASGGARMQEGILSLMQMPRSTIAVQMLRDAGLPYIVVLTHPTTGGVTASFAMLGDVHFAEPGALIGFAGPRVIEQTIREKLPEGFQRSEYLHEKGMVDQVVHRHEMRDSLSSLLHVLMKRGGRSHTQAPATELLPAPDAPPAIDNAANSDAQPTEELPKAAE